ncbi:hypothetical protein NDU88_001782 [Pleurodeles waltl]|uniref:Reverse transcriptase n=1 Tax=Pleurodeles waltl TaxID=8319 RepID=A0AAV7NL69_PLEWA|nr:hypothetical protein NDU88_001782 [Pleurodeles waltl]
MESANDLSEEETEDIPTRLPHLGPDAERHAERRTRQDDVTDNYFKLHKAMSVPGKEEITTAIDSIQLLWLDRVHCSNLDTPFSEEEVIQVIQTMPKEKAPGLDGFTTSFYKDYADLLAH